MNKIALSAEEFELQMKDLCERLEAYLQSGEGNEKRLISLAEELLDMADHYPQIYEKYRKVEGLLGETFARRTQNKFMPSGKDAGRNEKKGCLLGWLFALKKN